MSNSIKEKLSASQGGNNQFVQLPLKYSFSMAEDEQSETAFKSWNKETEQNEFYYEPLKGIYIGGAMKLSAYDDNLGSKGGNYFSSHYVNKENIVLFEPGKTIKRVCQGNMEEIEKWIATNTTSRAPRKKWCIFLLTEQGLVEVQTNITIAIDQLKKNKEAISERYVILVPTLYSPDNDLSKSCKEMLGKFATKNPPKYASLSTGELITEMDFENWDTENVIETFKEWKKQKASIQTTAAEPKAEEVISEEKEGEVFGKAQIPNINPAEIKDDLPF